jgi:hypothetical protein
LWRIDTDTMAWHRSQRLRHHAASLGSSML